MVWAANEAEQVLREQWDDAEQVGGFANDWQRVNKMAEMRKEFGEAVDAYDLLGCTTWADYEEGAEYTLWVKVEDQTLWEFHSGSTVYGEFGTDFAREIEPTSPDIWLEHVKDCDEHTANFQGW